MGEKKRRLASGSRPITDASAATLDAYRLFQSGDAGAARSVYQALLGKTIADPDALHRLGFLAIQFGEFERAEALLRSAVSMAPEQPWYCNTLGIALGKRRKHAEAVELLQRALARVPGQHELWSNLGNALRNEGRFAEAAHAFRRALRLAPNVGYYWSAFGICLRYAPAGEPIGAELRGDLREALVHPDVSPSDVAGAALAACKADPAIRRLVDHAADPDSEFAALLSEPAVAESFKDPLLLRTLESAVVADVEMELMLTRLRRIQLMSVAGAGTSILTLEAAVAIARQCFLNEYAWHEEPDEARAVATLSAAEPSQDAVRLATLAAYRPLSRVNGIESAMKHAGGPLAGLLRQQLVEPAEELRIQGELRRLAASANETSRVVKEQYEANPYPRWSRMGRFEHAEPAADVLGKLFPGRDFSRLPRSGVRVLVAGCGTGRHAIQAALRFADCRVLAFDLSLSSLAYAARKTREMGLARIEYCQGDIMALGGDIGPFDIIESVGVLHHLADPLAGWRALLDHLAPGGAMRVGLYSELGRRHIVRGQEFAASFSADAASLRKLRRAIIESRDDARLKRVCEIEDFFHLSGCRDLLMHVQEHRFNPGDLAAMLETLQLEFLGFELPDPRVAARYRESHPGDARLTDLDGWQAFEAKQPDTFFGMYDFWVRRRQDAHPAGGG